MSAITATPDISLREPILSNTPKYLEDAKVVLDVVLWIFLYLGDVEHLTPLEMGGATISVLLLRFSVATFLQDHGNPAITTADKIEKYTPHLECFSGIFITSFVMDGHLMTPDTSLWAIFASQLTLQTANQLAKRVAIMSKEDARYSYFQRDVENTDDKKFHEDAKFILENIALWLILYLGDTGVISNLAMGTISIGILSTRLFIDARLMKMENHTLNKVAKLSPYIEFLGGILLCTLMLSGVITPDDCLWAFFSLQLLILASNQIALRAIGEEKDRYRLSCFS